MRKALFALAMIGAAFAGGAVVNGTGLAWLQSALKAAGRKGEFVRVIASNENPAPPQPNAPPEPKPADPEPPREIPAAPLPPLVVHRSEDPKEIRETPKPPPPADASSPQSRPSADTANSSLADPDAPKPPEPLLASAVGVKSLPDPVSEAPPLDTPASKPVEPPRPPRVEKLPAPGEGPGPDGAVAQAQGLGDPPAAPGPVPPLTPPAGLATPAPAPAAKPGDWSDIRKRLRDLGVSRFEVDGELAGKVRFRCVIPLAGRRAVGQMFEGEGDDEFQAADAAIKRIHLWKVSEAPGS